MTASGPPQFSLNAFRQYEASILDILRAYPRPVVIDPRPLSPVTVSCRLRDAIRGWKRLRHPTTDLATMSRLLEMDAPPVIRIRDDGMIVAGGEKETLGEKGKPTLVQPLAGHDPINVDGTDDRAVDAVILLLDKRLLNGPVRISTPTEDTEKRLAELASKADVDLQKVGDQLYELF